MLTAQQLYYAQLSYIGEYSLTLTDYTGTAATAVRRAAILAINEGLAEMFRLNPSLFKRELGIQVLGPVAGTIGVSAGSTAVSAPTFTGYTAFCGNTIKLTGQNEYNQIRTEGNDTKLLFPYTGATGTVGAAVYGDALALDSVVSRPLGPVWLSDIRILVPLNGKPELLGYDPRQELDTDWGFLPRGVRRQPRPKLICQPEGYLADVHTLEAGTAQLRMMLTPLPDTVYELRFDAHVKPLPVDDDDIGEDDNSDPGRQFPVPDGNTERYLKPLVLDAWSKSAFFKDKVLKKELQTDAQVIRPEIENFRVQQQTGGHVVLRGWR